VTIEKFSTLFAYAYTKKCHAVDMLRFRLDGVKGSHADHGTFVYNLQEMFGDRIFNVRYFGKQVFTPNPGIKANLGMMAGDRHL